MKNNKYKFRKNRTDKFSNIKPFGFDFIAAYGIPQNPMEVLAQDRINNDIAYAEASQVLDPIMAGVNSGLDLAEQVLDIIPKDKWRPNKENKAYGGKTKIPVEVEGGETAQLPNGKMIGFEGRLHESGGIDVDLPEGTEVYSQRLTKDGKTLAQRKLEREITMSRIRRKKKNRSTDTLYGNTVKRFSDIAAYQEAQDQMYQDGVRNLVNQIYGEDSGVYPQFNAACGGRVKAWAGLDDKNKNNKLTTDEFLLKEAEKLERLREQRRNPDLVHTPTKPITEISTSPLSQSLVDNNIIQELKDIEAKYRRRGIIREKLTDPKNYPTFGDINVLAGNLYQGIAPYLTTLEQRGGDMPNVNTFKNYNKDAINSIYDAINILGKEKDTQLMDIERDVMSARNRMRNSTNSANVQRSMDSLLNLKMLGAKDKLNEGYNKERLGYFDKLSSLLSDRDLKYMTTEDARNERDIQDRDAFYKQVAADKAAIGRGIAQSGKDLNDMFLAKYYANLIDEAPEHNFGVDSKGRLYEKKKRTRSVRNRQ